MDFVSGALPNVMFIVGMIAIGIALGIEFKIVEIKGQLSKGGRIGAFSVGAALIIASIFLYTRPAATANTPVMQAAALPANAVAAAPTAQPAATNQAQQPAAPPTATPIPPTVTPEPPTATPIPPTATPEPPTATPEPPTATSIPGVAVPDIRGQSSKDAEKQLKAAGLRLGEKKGRCEEIGADSDSGRRIKKDQIVCQSPAPDSVAPLNTRIDYVQSGDDNHDDD
jgi:PASTA domain-containing protein